MLHIFALFGVLVGLAFGVGLLFLPTVIAKSRNHPNTLAIFLVNLFLGWTFIGWVVSLVWACTTPTSPVIYAPVYPIVQAPPVYPPQQQRFPQQAGIILPPSAPYPGPR